MSQRTFNILSIAAIFVAYAVTMRLTSGDDFVGCLLGGAANTILIVIFGLATRRIIMQKVVGTPLAKQLMAHLLLCAAFLVMSYGLLIVLLGLFYGSSPDGYVIRPFSLKSAAWQSLQNLTTYALIAAVSYLHALSTALSAQHELDPIGIGPAVGALGAEDHSSPDSTPSPAPAKLAAFSTKPLDKEPQSDTGISRYFVRIGEELRPLDIDSIISIGGAGDYSEVITQTGKHLVRVTLTEFAKSLDSSRYIRVHRSRIIDTHRISKAEPAGGGRLLLHMENGQSISTSREGAKLLRHRLL